MNATGVTIDNAVADVVLSTLLEAVNGDRQAVSRVTPRRQQHYRPEALQSMTPPHRFPVGAAMLINTGKRIDGNSDRAAHASCSAFVRRCVERP